MIHLNGTSEGDANRIQVVVEDAMFLGSIVRTRVRLKESVFSFDTFNNPNLTLPRRDEQITVAFPRDAVLVLHGGPARAAA
jgi:hypothetical protein